MKKIFALLLTLLLALPCFAATAEDDIIIDKIIGEGADFSFAEDAALLEIYFPKIYGCDAAFVRYGEYSMLIDCAGNQWRETEALLRKLNVTEIDYAVNSHPDTDHLGGFNHVLKTVTAGEFVLGFPEDGNLGDDVRFKVYEDLHKMDIPFRRVQNGDTLEFGDVQVTVIQRTDECLLSENNQSVMLMIELGSRRIFFTGDIYWQTQELLAAVGESVDLKADILKYPHHGYEYMHEGFLNKIAPDLVICTSGRGSANGAKQLKEWKIPHYFCENGILRLATDGNVWTIERVK